MWLHGLITTIFILSSATKASAETTGTGTGTHSGIYKKLPITGAKATEIHAHYEMKYLLDGDYATQNSFKSFCTRHGDSDGVRYVYVDLGAVYRVANVKLWGKYSRNDIYLNQMENIKITVAENTADLDQESSLCDYRNGLPLRGGTRPETFTCSSMMTGRYVKVSMANTTDQFQKMCLAEMEVYGLPEEEEPESPESPESSESLESPESSESPESPESSESSESPESPESPESSESSESPESPESLESPESTESPEGPAIYMKIPAKEVTGSKPYFNFKADYAIDGEHSDTMNYKKFCTQGGNLDTERYLYINLGDVYKVAEVKIWGKTQLKKNIPNLLENIKISVAENVGELDNEDSLCMFRDGLPSESQKESETFTCNNIMKGQYVKVSMVDVPTPYKVLCVEEMEVYGIEVPAKYRKIPAKEVTGSKPYFTFKAEYAIDGEYSDTMNYNQFCTRSGDLDEERYLYVNLGDVYQVAAVTIWGKKDLERNIPNLLENIKIFVAENVGDLDNADSLCVFRDGLPSLENKETETFTCNNIMRGQYVKVSMVNVVNPFMLLCVEEMEVYGLEIGENPETPEEPETPETQKNPVSPANSEGTATYTKIPAKEVTGSKPYYTFKVEYAIDGEYSDTMNYNQFCTRSGDLDEERYLYVNLGYVYQVAKVKVWGKKDFMTNTPNLLENIKISVAENVGDLNNPDSLCVFRNGLPSLEQKEEETFTCNNIMRGQYVKVSMVDVPSPFKLLCVEEMEVYGLEIEDTLKYEKLPIEGAYSTVTDPDSDPKHLIDGDHSQLTDLSRVFCSNITARYKSVYVHLGARYQVGQVKLWGTYHGAREALRMRNIHISVSDTIEGLSRPSSTCEFRSRVTLKMDTKPEIATCDRLMTGEYVKVSLKKISRPTRLCLAEMEVYGLPKEADPEMIPAVGVSGSGHFMDYSIDHINDNISSSEHATSFCTKKEPRYAQFDLGKLYNVTSVQLWITFQTVPILTKDTMNLKIHVAASEEDLESSTSLCATRFGKGPLTESGPEIFECANTMMGQYVKVNMVDTESEDFLCIAEMEVYGYNQQ